MATSSFNSLGGITTGIDTTALINAIVGMKGGNVTRLQARKDLNDKKTAALTAMRSSLSTLSLSMAALQDKFNGRTVGSSDSNNTNVTATATGAAAGNYDVTVHTVATRGRLSATLVGGLTTNLAVASPTDSVNSGVFTPGTPASFAIQGTDGDIKTFTLTETTNTLNGLRDAINASGAGVTASVLNMGKGDKPYQLVITAKETGTGSTGGVVTLVDITNMTGGTAGPVANNLGIGAGTADLVAKTITGVPSTGVTSSAGTSAVATDATFSVNGIELTRSTNLVKDAADGVTFTLKQGGQTGMTTLTVALDKAGATAAMQDFITKYNQLVKDYKAASTSTKNADGTIKQAPLANDTATRTLMNNLKATLAGASSGLPSDSTYKTPASLGITTLADGNLYLNTNTFQTAMANDLAAARRLFVFSGDSTNGVLSVNSGGSSTATGTVGYEITQDANGVLWGKLTHDGVTSEAQQVLNGTLQGTGDLAGLSLSVIGAGTGSMTLTRGVGQAANDLISKFTGLGDGTISSILTSITTQNKTLGSQILSAQALLDREKELLKVKFAKMEAAVSQMRSSAGTLSGA